MIILISAINASASVFVSHTQRNKVYIIRTSQNDDYEKGVVAVREQTLSASSAPFPTEGRALERYEVDTNIRIEEIRDSTNVST